MDTARSLSQGQAPSWRFSASDGNEDVEPSCNTRRQNGKAEKLKRRNE